MKEKAVAEPLTCAAVDEQDLAARYVAGTLSDDGVRQAFEDHFVACDRCREEVRLAMAIRTELVRRAGAPRVPWLPLGVLAAAALAGVLLLRSGGSRAALAPLGAVADPPIYLGQAVRGTTAPADSIFAAAMAAYDDRRYADAGAGLTRALAAGVDSAPALFFLGASELMAGRSTDAAAAFRRVLSLGDTPYLPEAHYYRAKALLRLGDGAGALAELAQVPAGDSIVASQAAALADSVRKSARR